MLSEELVVGAAENNRDRIGVPCPLLAPSAEMDAPPAALKERDASARCGIFTGLFAGLFV